MAEPIDPTLMLADGPVRLRPWRPGDADALFAAGRESIATVGRWLPWCHPEYTRDESVAWLAQREQIWASGEQYDFAVLDASDDTLLGGIGLNHRNRMHRNANLGYWIRASAEGRGFATCAARAAARFGFAQLDLARVEIVTLPDNAASRRVALALGARFEAIARHRVWMGNRAWDAAVHGLLPEDLAQPAAAQSSAS